MPTTAPVPVAGASLTVDATLALTDPCGAEYPDVVVADAAGSWHASVRSVRLPDWGLRTTALVLDRDDATSLAPARSVGHVNIDTGTLAALDAGALPDGEDDRLLEDCFAACRSGQVSAVPGVAAVVCCTGLGDGGYDVVVRDDASGRPAHIEVTFLTDEDVEALRKNPMW